MRRKHRFHMKRPEKRAFVVSLYPIPGKRGNTLAESLDGIESVGVLTDGTDYEGNFGVLFPEICHTLYEGQSLAEAPASNWDKNTGIPRTIGPMDKFKIGHLS